MDILEAKCNMLRNLALNLHKHSLSANSTHADIQEEEMVHQFNEPIDIEKQHSPHSAVDQDEATNLHVFIK